MAAPASPTLGHTSSNLAEAAPHTALGLFPSGPSPPRTCAPRSGWEWETGRRHGPKGQMSPAAPSRPAVWSLDQCPPRRGPPATRTFPRLPFPWFLGPFPSSIHGRSPTPAWALSHPHQGSLCLQALQMALASSRAKNCPSPAPNPPGRRAGPSPEQAQPFPPDPCPPATSEACPLWAVQLSGAETAKAAGLGPEGVCFRPGLYGAWAAEQQEPRGASPRPPDADLQLQGQ